MTQLAKKAERKLTAMRPMTVQDNLTRFRRWPGWTTATAPGATATGEALEAIFSIGVVVFYRGNDT